MKPKSILLRAISNARPLLSSHHPMLLLLSAWLWAGTAPPQAFGAVLVLGENIFGQLNVPVAAQSGVIAVAAGANHIAVLKNDGSGADLAAVAQHQCHDPLLAGGRDRVHAAIHAQPDSARDVA